MKNISYLFCLMLFSVSALGQTSNGEKTGFWDQGASWGGGVFPGSVSSGTITATSNVIVIDGTIKSKKNISLNLSNVTVNAGDTVVILGNLDMLTSALTNNGVLIVMGNVTNGASNSVNNGSGKMVVTGNYVNALGSNTFTGPSYVYGSTSGFVFAPAVSSKANLISNDPALYSYVTTMNGTLPVELASFNASVDNTSVILTWSTSSEINNDHFVIERSANGKTFDVIATPTGAGNSKELLQYSFTDLNPIAGNSYYRISQVDFDGHTVQFHVVYVDFTKQHEITIYPNPSTEYLLVNATGYYSYVIKDVRGLSTSHSTLQEVTPGKTGINVSELRPGVYYLELTDNNLNNSKTFRFVKN